MNKYNLILVIIWILILSICKDRIIKKINNFFNFTANKPIDNIKEKNDLLKNIENEFLDIKLVLNTEILSLQDKFQDIRSFQPIDNTTTNIKKDIHTNENDNEEKPINMNQVLNKTIDILKQFVYTILHKIKSYLF